MGAPTRIPCPAVERLSALLDSDLAPAETEIVWGHAADCARCTAALAELGALVSAARALEIPEPPPTLWRALEGTFEDGDSRSRGLSWLPSWSFSLKSWRPFAIGALVGASAFALALTALPTARGRFAAGEAGLPAATASVSPPAVADPLLEEAEAEFQRAAASYERLIAKLRVLLARAEQGWSAEERARIAERLTGLDDVIARSRTLARQTPGDSAGNEQLFAAYQQKIAFLAEAVHRGVEWSDRTP